MTPQFSLARLRHAEMICFPEDFIREYEAASGEPAFPVGTRSLFGYLMEYGHNQECLVILEKMIEALTPGFE